MYYVIRAYPEDHPAITEAEGDTAPNWVALDLANRHIPAVPGSPEGCPLCFSLDHAAHFLSVHLAQKYLIEDVRPFGLDAARVVAYDDEGRFHEVP